jgi:hypothetical protein
MNPQPKDLAQILHSAVELHPDQRSPFLDEACAGDAPLRREIESLLSSTIAPETSSLHPRWELASEV